MQYSLLIYKNQKNLLIEDMYFQKIIQWIKQKFENAKQSILLIAIYCSSSQLKVFLIIRQFFKPVTVITEWSC